MEEKYTLSMREASALVGCSLPFMYDISHRADFPACVVIGRKRVILRHRLLEWLERQAEPQNRGA